MHDFRQLSPLDFELLIRDLLQAEMKVRIESFGPGKDGGIDFRFARAGQTAIIQVKHYMDSPARSLVRAAAKENSKVAQLNSDRYIFATSAALTPALKDQIVAAMPDARLVVADVLGREDINNLLGRHPQILRQHFKLWLTDTETLDRIVHSGIYNRTDAELSVIKILVPRFVQNNSVAAAEAILLQRGALIIAGEPGVGKTTLARILTWLHIAQDWRVFVVDDLKEAMEVSTPGEKRLILLDDFLGQISLTNDTIREIDQRLPVFLDRVRGNNELRFILTTRSYLLSQAQMQSARLASEKVLAAELVLNVGTYTRSIRAQIVFNHIYFSDLTEEEKGSLVGDSFYLKMIDHRNFSPRLIDLLTSADYQTLQNAPIREVVMSVLDNPAALWEIPYRSHLSEESRTVLRALFFCGHWTSVDRLVESFKRHWAVLGAPSTDVTVIVAFRRALKPLEGSFIALYSGHVYFSNPGVKDFLNNVVITDGLLRSVVNSVGTVEELDNAVTFYGRHRQACRSQMGDETAWVEAFDRIRVAAECSNVRLVGVALEAIALLERAKGPVLAMTEEMLASLSSEGVDADDEVACRHALEHFQSLSAGDQEVLISIDALVQATASMLGSSGDRLSLDEIRGIAKAIDVHGEKPELASSAAGDALRGFLGELTERGSEVSSTTEFDSFESELSGALARYGVPLAVAFHRTLSEHREYLEEKEAEQDKEGYKSTSRPPRDSDASDEEVTSLFSTLLQRS